MHIIEFLLIGVALCLAGAVAVAFLLPGRLPAQTDSDVEDAEPIAA